MQTLRVAQITSARYRRERTFSSARSIIINYTAVSRPYVRSFPDLRIFVHIGFLFRLHTQRVRERLFANEYYNYDW